MQVQGDIIECDSLCFHSNKWVVVMHRNNCKGNKTLNRQSHNIPSVKQYLCCCFSVAQAHHGISNSGDIGGPQLYCRPVS